MHVNTYTVAHTHVLVRRITVRIIVDYSERIVDPCYKYVVGKSR